MCVDDWRFGRLIRSSHRAFAGTAANQTIAAANQQRVGILISQLGTIPDGLLSCAAGGVTRNMFTMARERAWFYFTLLEHGDLPTHEWLMNAPLLTTTSVTEFTLPEEYLTAALESLRKEYQPWLKLN